MEKKFELLDKYCFSIFGILLFKENLKFNELYRTLRDWRVKISKPTLSDHLQHLIETDIVLREVVDVQNVNYSLNPSLDIKDFKYFADKNLRSDKELADEKKILFSMSIDDQVEEVLRIIGLRTLAKIKTRIIFELNRTFGNGLILMAIDSPFLSRHENWIIEKSLENEEYRKKVLLKIDDLMDKIWG